MATIKVDFPVETDDWIIVTPRENNDLPPHITGRAEYKFHNEHTHHKTYVVEYKGTTHILEHINSQWYRLAWSEKHDLYSVKKSTVVPITHPVHPCYMPPVETEEEEVAHSSPSEANEPKNPGIAAAEELADDLYLAPIFEDVAESNEPPQPKEHYLPTVKGKMTQ